MATYECIVFELHIEILTLESMKDTLFSFKLLFSFCLETADNLKLFNLDLLTY